MNEYDLHKELERNNADKEIVQAELEASKNKFAKYALSHMDSINKFHQPIVVKKKKSVRFKEFIDKIKAILGLTKNTEIDGTKTYLQHCENFE